MSEKSSRRFWISLIIGFFMIDIVIATIAITMAVQDPSFRSIPGFSQRSVNWGDRQDRQRTLERLGWTIEVDPANTNQSQLALKVLDQDNNPVSDAELDVTLFHYTRVAEQQNTKLEFENGIYAGKLNLDKPGFWNIDIEGRDPHGETFWKQMRWEHPKQL